MSLPPDAGDDLGRIEDILGDEAVWAQPPGEVEPAVLASIAGAEVAAATPARERPRSRWWPTYVTAAVVAAVVLLLVVAPSDDEPAPSAVFILNGTGLAAGAVAEAAVGPAEAGWWIRLQIDDLDPAPAGSYYEGWLSNGVDLVSVGTFHMRDGDSVVLWSGVPMVEFPELSVTLQEISSGTDRSTAVVLTGRLDP